MGKTKGPLFSVDAKGTIGKALTYQGGMAGKYVKGYNKPGGTPSSSQLLIRQQVARAVNRWKNLTDWEKTQWNYYKDGNGLQGYHAFIRRYMINKRDNEPVWKLPDGTWYRFTEEFTKAVSVQNLMVLGENNFLQAHLYNNSTIQIDGITNSVIMDDQGSVGNASLLKATRILPNRYDIESKGLKTVGAQSNFGGALGILSGRHGEVAFFPSGELTDYIKIGITGFSQWNIIMFLYWDNDGTQYHWNPSTQLWTTGAAGYTPYSDQAYYIIRITKDYMNYHLYLYDASRTPLMSAILPISWPRDEGYSDIFILGNPITDTSYQYQEIESIIYME